MEKDTVLSKINFPVGQPRNSFSLKQDSILGSIYDKIIRNHLEVTKPDKN